VNSTFSSMFPCRHYWKVVPRLANTRTATRAHTSLNPSTNKQNSIFCPSTIHSAHTKIQAVPVLLEALPPEQQVVLHIVTLKTRTSQAENSNCKKQDHECKAIYIVVSRFMSILRREYISAIVIRLTGSRSNMAKMSSRRKPRRRM
jgi:hypothetical protein